ncbi:MAG: hypothetical protein ACLQGU_00050 [bacterium]
MKKVLIQALIILILGFIPYSVYAVEYAFTPIDVPYVSSTYASGISGKNIVGTYADFSVWHGFLYNGKTYTTLDDPDGVSGTTEAQGIFGKNIVGYYQDASSNYHGFLYNGSTKTYTTIDVPGAKETEAWGISGENIVGYYEDSSGNDYGFLYNGKTYSTLDVPGAKVTWACGISGRNIVGMYEDASSNYHGFLYNGSTKTYTTIDVPGAGETEAWGISGRNIVGTYYADYDGTWNGFLATPTSDTSTPPTIVEFSVYSPSTSLTVSITTFTAIDNVEITGYMVTTSAMAPSAKSSKWSATPPTSFTFPSTTKSGTKTLYAWTKDADGNVSKSLSAQVTLNLL